MGYRVSSNARAADEFLAAAREAGLNITRFDEDDRSVKRCGVFGHGDRKERGTDGAYQYWREGKSYNGRPHGWYENHTDGTGRVDWQYKGDPAPAPAQRPPDAEAKADAEAEAEARKRELTQRLMKQLIAESRAATADDPYINAKGISDFRGELYADANGAVYVPFVDLLNGGALVTIQTIKPKAEGGFDKRFWRGAKISEGAAYLIDGDPDNTRVFIGEGVATVESAAAALARGGGFRAVLAAGDVGKVKKFANNAARELYPDADIYILADDDYKREAAYLAAHPDAEPGEAEAQNKGLTEARRLMKSGAVDGILIPPFSREAEAEATASDWNDFYTLRGREATTEALEAAIKAAREEAKTAPTPKKKTITPEEAEARRAEGIAKIKAETGKPVIDISQTELCDSAQQTIDALLKLTPDKAETAIYRYNGKLARIVPTAEYDLSGKRRIVREIEYLTKENAGKILSEAVYYATSTRAGDIRPTDKITQITLAVTTDRLAPFPYLRGITQLPIIHADGTIITARGYDAESGLYHDALAGIDIPTAPTREDAIKAATYFIELFSEFPFVEPADEANAIGLLLTVVMKEFIGLTPLFLINAPSGTGKSYLGQGIGAVAEGDIVAAAAAPTTPEEWQKTIATWILSGARIKIIDNIKQGGALADPSLAGLITSEKWEGRALGANTDIRGLNRLIVIATGINIRVSREHARRFTEIRLDARMEDPTERTFKRDLHGFIKSHRAEILSKLFTMIRAWIVAGRPKWQRTPWPSFVKWSETIGGILDFCGFISANGKSEFLANKERSRAALRDTNEPQWGALLGEIFAHYGNGAWQAKEIAAKITASGWPQPDNLIPGKDGNIARPLGQKFISYEGQVFITPDGAKLRVISDGTTDRNGSKIWYIQQIDEKC